MSTVISQSVFAPQSPSAAPEDDANQEVVIRVEDLRKKYCLDLKRSLLYGAGDFIRDALVIGRESQRLRRREFWALNGVSFELRRGEALGLVGPNGSGKTTLMRLLSGLLRPDGGTIRVKGRIAPLIALGAFFAPVLSGRENIRIVLAMLGLSRSEIEDRMDEVIGFSELGEAIASPVRTYSSGMQARLGFACAIQARPDILLLDEILAVGDLAFRDKCRRAISAMRDAGVSIILVSHNINMIYANCDRALLLNKGELLADGGATEVIANYDRLIYERAAELHRKTLTPRVSDDASDLPARIVGAVVSSSNGNGDVALVTGSSADIVLKIECREPIHAAFVRILVKDLMTDGAIVLQFHSARDGKVWDLPAGRHELICHLQCVNLAGGHYQTKIHLCQGSDMNILHSLSDLTITVVGIESVGPSRFYQPVSWHAGGQGG